MSQFQNSVQGRLNIIKCPDVLNDASCDQVDLLSPAWAALDVDGHVIDFKEVKSISTRIYRSFVRFRQLTKNRSQYVFSIHVSKQIETLLADAGVTAIFQPTANLEASIRELKSSGSTAKLDSQFIQVLSHAARTTLTVQCNTPVEELTIQAKNWNQKSDHSILAVVSLTGGNLRATLVLAFPEKVFLHIYKNMFGETPTKIAADNQDAAGELLNIILGMSKKELNDYFGFQIQKALPSVIIGSNLETPPSPTQVGLVLPFKTEAGIFQLEVHF